MPAKRYPVRLEKDQRETLMTLISSGREAARKLTRARILLKADENQDGSPYTDKQIKEALEVSLSTIERTRKTFALEGLTAALTPKKTIPRPSAKVRWRKRSTSGRSHVFRSARGICPMDVAAVSR